jgi:hypothetical protein
MNRANPRMLELAEQLLAYEAAAVTYSEKSIPALVSVSEKLSRSISTLAGTMGFRSLLVRALSLAKVQAHGLAAVQVKSDGSLGGVTELANGEAEEAAVELIAQLLGMLSTFIGETLTLRLLQEAWPNLPAIDGNPSGNEHDSTR